MKITVQEIYKCEHCNKLYQIKSACEKHEERCTMNPDNIRPCHRCLILEKVEETIFADYGDIHGNEVEIKVNVLFCKKRDCFIYPPSVGYKGNAFDMGNKENIEMPIECKLQKK